jgi:hypothetical protein
MVQWWNAAFGSIELDFGAHFNVENMKRRISTGEIEAINSTLTRIA